MKKSATILLLMPFIFVVFLISGCATSNDNGAIVPTRMEVAVLSTPIPSPTATPLPHRTIESLIYNVVGTRMDNSRLNVETDVELGTRPHPSGKTGYYTDVYIKDPTSLTRHDMLQIVYDIMHEYHYNYIGGEPLYLHLILRNDLDYCVMSMGLGNEATQEFLPKEPPQDLDTWFAAVDRRDYYGYSLSFPDLKDELMAFADDYPDAPECVIDEWKKRR